MLIFRNKFTDTLHDTFQQVPWQVMSCSRPTWLMVSTGGMRIVAGQQLQQPLTISHTVVSYGILPMSWLWRFWRGRLPLLIMSQENTQVHWPLFCLLNVLRLTNESRHWIQSLRSTNKVTHYPLCFLLRASEAWTLAYSSSGDCTIKAANKKKLIRLCGYAGYSVYCCWHMWYSRFYKEKGQIIA